MKRFCLSLLVFICLPALSFRVSDVPAVHWISLAELKTSYAQNPRPILIDVYTDWCGWCKEMDRTTYKNRALVDYINTHYYAVRFDAESRDDVFFNHAQYRYNAQYRTNMFAVYLTGGRLSFPTTVLLADTSAAPAPIAGYLKAKEMEAPLKYFGERANERQSYPDFNRGIHPDW